MPLRLLAPMGIIAGSWKLGDWIYERLRLKWYGYHRNMNTISSKWFGADDTDIPPIRKLTITQQRIDWGNFILYEEYLYVKYKEDVKKLTQPDPEEAAIPKMVVNNDITLKQSLVTGKREKERYIFDNIMQLPGYYTRWRDRTRDERDAHLKTMADKGIIVYGTPYWNGIKSNDLN
mmetsp:Transcript_11558/g.17494  ORF Transcript_11558/g.17494 Transcript_11558/m.17494 type:complete len:176 (+) Transcript_11558:35-562(+)|eukprot:CAMPEP_0202694222 /NCGR_PEP_ID=MMETSP1385-20130828/8140_1 /ASSEMBLY_ACC=CAM_ASM_000861 /TAXON_ID=933848 /ORGANISM="Elphidium margaritaceum" /LENGTH=175 /DNA_ID=CAMNT_0049350033 /DNA_START=35 /DNA_END=562 /DNA_ORIENTATION=+